MRLPLLTIMALLCGCSQDSPEEKDRDELVGNWGVELANVECGIEFGFRRDHTYASLELCRSASGTDEVLIQAERGVYSLDRPWMTLDPDQSTCAQATTHDIRYGVSGGALTMFFGALVLAFERLPNTTPDDPTRVGAQASLGCFDDDGYLVPGPIRPVQ